ncbi:MAG: response regulator transcription factor [Saprospiraceae bacterium]|nr:response regulator transcription factor [Saprospiraceae bacterium]MBK8547733.1 response regulator transcription factor [Saprospiraceae bacterium]MBK8854870.1 response regulator transcription factor [Saprospiraceae bacterium]MBK9042579.1 response regulator transcription factor [Saprospiraceae bacterium]MBP6695625.1 response regulator transcription factor [Saprospiraceae bacterium]
MIINVFIYDDNEARRDSLIALLELTDFMHFVGSAANCTFVEQDMLSSKPDVVLMDIEMPETDGIEGVKRIKSKYPHIKVIMQTVYEDSDKIFNALRYGAEGYILKKASVNHIIESIKEVYNGGAFMTPSVAMQVMNFIKKPTPSDQKMESLSPRESEVLKYLSEGDSYKMIADRLKISYGTVNNHIKKIYEKLQVHSLGEAVSYALKNNINH